VAPAAQYPGASPSLHTRSSYDRLGGNWCMANVPTATVAHEGTSPGEGDFYPAQLVEQWVDVTGLEPGTYTLRGIANPNHAFIETTEADNVHTELRVIPGPTAAPQTVRTDPGQPASVTFAGGLVGPELLAYDGCGNLWLASCYLDALDGSGNPEPLTFAVAHQPDHGTLSVLAPVDGTHASVVYTPAPGTPARTASRSRPWTRAGSSASRRPSASPSVIHRPRHSCRS
jgi:hypothetical protein